MAQKQKVSFNEHDENQVKKKLKLNIEIFNEKCERNFEAVARKFRYNFFSKVYK